MSSPKKRKVFSVNSLRFFGFLAHRLLIGNPVVLKN